MIHAHLIGMKKEDAKEDNYYHGRNFKQKMKEINVKACIQITVG